MNELINNPSATIVDVRTETEFASGHVEGSINIPLDTVPNRIEEFADMSKPLILCCKSGNRSGQAMAFLQQHDIEDMHNGGSWTDVQLHKM